MKEITASKTFTVTCIDDAVVYLIVPSVDSFSFTRNTNNELVPDIDSSTIKVRKVEGTDVEWINDMGRNPSPIRYMYIPGGKWREGYDINDTIIVESTKTNYCAVLVELSNSDYKTVDTKTIPIIKLGLNGKSIYKRSETITYKVTDNGVTTPTGNWYNTKADAILENAWGLNKYMWTRTVITWSDDSTTTLYTNERNPNDGQPGQNIIVDGATVMKYYVSDNNSTHPGDTSSDWKNLNLITLTQGKWLWSQATTYYRKANSAEGTHDGGTPSRNYNVSYIAVDGTSVTLDTANSYMEYAISSYGVAGSNREYPSDISSWSRTIPAAQKGKYLWTKDVTAYSDNKTTTTYGVSYYGTDGNSVEIDANNTFVKYSSVKTASKPNDSTFTLNSPPSLEQGDYLWSLSLTKYVGVNNPLKSYSVSYVGTDGSKGDPGPDGLTTHFAYSTSANGSLNFSVTNFSGATYIGTYKDNKAEDSTDYTKYTWTKWKGETGNAGRGISSVKEYYKASANATGETAPNNDSGWTTNPNTAMNNWNLNAKYLWNYEKTTYTSGTTVERTTPLVLAIWTKDGEPGRGIDSIVNHYAISNNGTTAPLKTQTGAQGWDDNPIAPNSTYPYLWNYETITWTKGTPSTQDTTPLVIGHYGTDGISVIALYSTNQTNWHNTFASGDIWMRTSTDNGSTWSSAMKIVGENGSETNFSFGISQYETTTNSTTAPGDISSWSDAPIPVTTLKPYLWSKVLQKDKTGNTVSTKYIRLTGLQGNPGNDGISVIVNPSTLIINLDINNPSNLDNLSSDNNAIATINLMRGSSNLNVTGLSCTSLSGIGSTSGTDYQISGNTIRIKKIGKTNGEYNKSGYVIVTASYSGGSVTNIKIPFYCNLLGTWKETIENDAKTVAAQKVVTEMNERGVLTTTSNEYTSLVNSTQALESWKSTAQSTINGHTTSINNQNTRLTTAEGNINTVSSAVNNKFAQIDGEYKITKLVDASHLDNNCFYPVSLNLQGVGSGSIFCRVLRPLDKHFGEYITESSNGGYRQPTYARHSSGVLVNLEWSTIAGSWGTREIASNWGYTDDVRIISDYTINWDKPTSTVPSVPSGYIVGSIGQITERSKEIVYVRGGSKYLISCSKDVDIELHSGGLSEYLQETDEYRYRDVIESFNSLVVPRKDTMSKSLIEQTADNIRLEVSDSLYSTGIDITSGKITLNASKTEIKNGDTTAAMFTDGKIKADYIDAQNVVTNGLSANTINANSATIQNLKLTSAEVSGNITANGGKIGGFNIGTTSIYSDNRNINLDATNGTAKITGEILATSGKIGLFSLSGNYLDASYSNSTSGDSPRIWINDTKNGVSSYFGRGSLDSGRSTYYYGSSFKNTKSQSNPNVAIYVNAENSTYSNYAFFGKGNGILNGFICGYACYTYEWYGNNDVQYSTLRNGSNRLFLYSEHTGCSLILPEVDEITKLCGSTSNMLAIPLYIHGDIATKTVTVHGRDSSYSNSKYPVLVNNSGSYFNSDNVLNIESGDYLELLLVYSPSYKQIGNYYTNYTARLIDSRR